MSVRITMVVAAARNGIIGRDGKLPWHVPSDLKTFRRLTVGKPVIMGRKTFEAIGRPLPKRPNIVVTRDGRFTANGAEVAGSLEAALDRGRVLAAELGVDEVAVIGGGEIYKAARAVADRIYLTRIDAAPDGDAAFTDPDDRNWTLTSREAIQPDPADDHAAELLIYDRTST
ncbi:MAG: dihydrofolate reductase [Pseudomonadota bacterium]